MKDLDELLKTDALADAEKITGVSIHDKTFDGGFDNPSVALGFLLMQENAAAKEAALTELGDTTLTNKLDRYQKIIESYGFEQVLADKFTSRSGDEETFFIYAHRKGLILSFDTFSGTRVNGGEVYYNWRPLVPIKEAWQCTSSGGYYGSDEDPIWAGNHDCRESLIHNLNKLNNRGEFLASWIKEPFLWFVHYQESKEPEYDYEAITNARIERLPDWVKGIILGSQIEEREAR